MAPAGSIRAHIQRAHEFFERHGGKAVVLGRFVPIVRTFVPLSPARPRCRTRPSRSTT